MERGCDPARGILQTQTSKHLKLQVSAFHSNFRPEIIAGKAYDAKVDAET